MQSYCSNLECEELCYILEGKGTIHKLNSEPIEFNKGDIIFINKKDIYYLYDNFKLSIVLFPSMVKRTM